LERELVNPTCNLLVVATLAGSRPEKTFAAYRNFFAKMGKEAEHLSRELILEDPVKAKEMLNRSEGIYFTGGDQELIFEYLLGSGLIGEVRKMCQRKTVIGGVSAGAACMGEVSLYSISGEESVDPFYREVLKRFEGNRLASSSDTRVDLFLPALNLLPLRHVWMDSHYNSKDSEYAGRQERGVAMVATYPWMSGIGLDENTALTIEDNGRHCLVSGTGKVHFLTACPVGVKMMPEYEWTVNGNMVYRFEMEPGDIIDLYSWQQENRRTYGNSGNQSRI
jgi:cyanophycinase